MDLESLLLSALCLERKLKERLSDRLHDQNLLFYRIIRGDHYEPIKYTELLGEITKVHISIWSPERGKPARAFVY